MQIWTPPTTLSIRYTASSSDRLAVLAVDLINSRYTYYNAVNKRIHIISAYFLAAASDKHMRLLTSLYDINAYFHLNYLFNLSNVWIRKFTLELLK